MILKNSIPPEAQNWQNVFASVNSKPNIKNISQHLWKYFKTFTSHDLHIDTNLQKFNDKIATKKKKQTETETTTETK